MSRFLSTRYSALTPYTPGEQPQDKKYIKLNTNESPFPPSAPVIEAVERESRRLNLYSDPECRALRECVAAFYGVSPDRIVMTNGSDEILNFIFAAYGDTTHPFAFPAVSYGFYPVFAELNRVPYKAIPLREDFSVNAADYEGIGMNIVIANPNAPTGLYMPVADIERIVASNPENIVTVDEAYIDFGAESCVGLVDKYKNLIVTRTFSKSYSMAGARLGFGIADEGLIADMNTLRYSTNPYNVNRMTAAAGEAAIRDNAYYARNCRVIAENRAWTSGALKSLGFTVTDSMANFVFARHPEISGEELYLTLRRNGILVRHFTTELIKEYNRITIGTREQMESLVAAVATILNDRR